MSDGRVHVLTGSIRDGLWIGAIAGAVYALLVAASSLLGAGSSRLGAVGLALIAALIAVPAGILCGAAIGVVFGGAAAVRGRTSRWGEPVWVAVIGLVLIAVVCAAAGVTGGALAWAGGPLVTGTPAAAWHARRLRRRLPPPARG